MEEHLAGMKATEAKRMAELEAEKVHLKKIVDG